MRISVVDISFTQLVRLPSQYAILLFALFAALWALLEAVLGARLHNHYNLMQVVWWRYAAHLGLMFGVWGWRQPSRLWQTRRLGFQIARSVLMLVMPLSFVATLFVGESADTVWAMFWVTPILVLLAAWLWLGERSPAWLWLATPLGTATAVFILKPQAPHSTFGVLLSLMMALSFSSYVVMTRSLRGESVLTNLFYTALGVFVLLSVLMPWVWVTPSVHDALYLSAIGVVGFVALWALDRACGSAPVSFTAPALYSHLGCLLVVGWIFLDKPITLHDVVGCVLVGCILLGLWAMQPFLPHVGSATDISRGAEYGS